MKTELIKKLRQLDVIYREPVDLKHGAKSLYYVDIKKAYGYPKILEYICDCIWEQMNKSTTCIAASGYGGISVATILSVRHNLKLTLVRDEPKKHGKGGWLDGYEPIKEDKVSIFDDVLTTGGSLGNMIKVIKEETEAKILGCYVVVKRGEWESDIPLSHLLVPEDLL